jgi:hypothetical protein
MALALTLASNLNPHTWSHGLKWSDRYGDGSNLQYKSGQDDTELIKQVEGEDEDC